MPPYQKLLASGFPSPIRPAWVLKQPVKGLVPNLGDGARNKFCLVRTPEETVKSTIFCKTRM